MTAVYYDDAVNYDDAVYYDRWPTSALVYYDRWLTSALVYTTLEPKNKLEVGQRISGAPTGSRQKNRQAGAKKQNGRWQWKPIPRVFLMKELPKCASFQVNRLLNRVGQNRITIYVSVYLVKVYTRILGEIFAGNTVYIWFWTTLLLLKLDRAASVRNPTSPTIHNNTVDQERTKQCPFHTTPSIKSAQNNVRSTTTPSIKSAQNNVPKQTMSQNNVPKQCRTKQCRSRAHETMSVPHLEVRSTPYVTKHLMWPLCDLMWPLCDLYVTFMWPLCDLYVTFMWPYVTKHVRSTPWSPCWIQTRRWGWAFLSEGPSLRPSDRWC